MKDKTFKNIRICCYVVLVFCALWIAVMMNYLLADVLGYGPWQKSVDWSQHAVMKAVILGCWLLGTLAMIALCIKAVVNVLRGLRENTVFPKNNVKLLLWIALADFIYQLGFVNLSFLWREPWEIHFNHTNLIMPFFLLFFAFMYKVAADAVEENNLTI